MSPPSIELRDVRSSDLASIHAINEANTPAVGSATIETLAAIVDQSLIALVGSVASGASDRRTPDSVTVGDTPVIAGFCLVLAPGADYESVNYRWFGDRYHDFIYLDRVAIAAPYQGIGLGRRFYVEVERRAVELRPGATDFTLEVNLRPRNEGSLAFHDRLGFSEVGQHDTPKGVRVSLMTKSLR
jgi:predicted GNAT superfamily acetyltransferase